MKHWLTDRFLPMWAKQSVLQDNRRLIRENERLSQENRQLQAYIRGVQAGLRGSKRVTIATQGGNK